MKPIIVVVLVMITMSASPSASMPEDITPEVFRPIDSMIVTKRNQNFQQLDTAINQLQQAAVQYAEITMLIDQHAKS
ncbi:hypothetical protein [Chitinophaga sp. Cy-1792]|uniref:hypothetical protein n=1 Tax=Chitinophaga sp. Cy-1792 TaxID=2608339 RepID=UPI001421ADEA|nr:hypothetical protein [Chitinophaga sp. Cy-1792]NIG54732.1 hypothetical protein [Chitinophaga sp. Cy-1792]